MSDNSSSVETSAKFGHTRSPLVRRRPAFVFLVICAAGALITWFVYTAEVENRQARLDRRLADAARLVQTRFEQHLALLTATRAFFTVFSDQPSRYTFSAFVSGLSLRAEYAGLQGVGFSRILAPGAEAEVGERIRADYRVERAVWPERAGDLRTSIVLLEPADERNIAAIGFDMASEARRREAMERALRTREPSATEPLTLVQEITAEQQVGILVYLPFDSARSGLRGFVYAPIRMGDFFRAALAGHSLPLELRAFDADRPDLPLYATPGFDTASEAGSLRSLLNISIAGREWIFDGVATEGFLASERPRFAIITAVVFTLLALAAGVAVTNQETAVVRARALNAEIERRAEQKDFLLREMSHRIKNSISRALAIVQLSANASPTKAELVESVTVRLRAMAAAQELIVASGTDRAELAALLRSELQQLYGGRLQPNVMQGPPVNLDARQTLALGLAVHELATNSLKYGAGASPEGELDVRWWIDEAKEERELVIVWDEFVPEGTLMRPSLPPTGSGFGSKLIDACVRNDLGGTMKRDLHAEGLTVELRVPLP